MLVDISDLIARLPFTMDEDETREAEGALSDLSFDAQALGNPIWATPDNTPQPVKNLIVRAAARHMKNYEGYIASRAGDEAVQWAEQDTPGQATFTTDEKRMLRQMGGRMHFIGGVGTTAWGAADRVQYRVGSTDNQIGYVQVEGNGSAIPMVADQTSPYETGMVEPDQ